MIFVQCYYKLSLVRPTFQISKNLNLNGTCIKINFFQNLFQIWMCDSCDKTLYGCCIDLENAATGPNFEGCPGTGAI